MASQQNYLMKTVLAFTMASQQEDCIPNKVSFESDFNVKYWH